MLLFALLIDLIADHSADRGAAHCSDGGEDVTERAAAKPLELKNGVRRGSCDARYRVAGSGPPDHHQFIADGFDPIHMGRHLKGVVAADRAVRGPVQRDHAVCGADVYRQGI